MNAEHHASARSSAGGTSSSARSGPSEGTRAKTQTARHCFGWAKKEGCRFPQCAFLHEPAKKYRSGSTAASDGSRSPSAGAGGSQAGTQARGQARHRVVRQLALPLYLATRGGRDSAPSGSTLGRDRAAATRREAPLVHPGVAPVSRSGVVESLKRCLEVWGDLSVTEGGRECLKRTLGCIADAYFELFSVQW